MKRASSPAQPYVIALWAPSPPHKTHLQGPKTCACATLAGGKMKRRFFFSFSPFQIRESLAHWAPPDKFRKKLGRASPFPALFPFSHPMPNLPRISRPEKWATNMGVSGGIAPKAKTPPIYSSVFCPSHTAHAKRGKRRKNAFGERRLQHLFSPSLFVPHFELSQKKKREKQNLPLFWENCQGFLRQLRIPLMCNVLLGI